VRAEENGLIVPKRAPYAIAEAVLEICKKNLGGEMGKKSRQLVMDYDWKEIARKTIREYEKLLLKGIGHRA
jgi:glycosyltransferase involved in cell wall biosynthesis